jgi:hypothetical protein
VRPDARIAGYVRASSRAGCCSSEVQLGFDEAKGGKPETFTFLGRLTDDLIARFSEAAGDGFVTMHE